MTNPDDLTGRELDALIAERIMGGKLDPTRRAEDGSPLLVSEVPRYSSSAPAARGIMFKLEQRYPGISMRHEAQIPYKTIVRGPSGREYTAVDASEPTAICRAMLKAVLGEGPGLPADMTKRQLGPRAAAAVAEMLGTRAAPHQSVGLSALAITLHQGEHKEGAARALLEYAGTSPHLVRALVEQAERGEREIASMCVAALDFMVQAGEAARAALPRATQHPDPEVAKSAREALARAAR